jgi:hypothetical protein
MAIKTMTGVEVRHIFQAFLNELKDDDQVFFGSGDLSFYNVKPYQKLNGEKSFAVEFNEVYKITAE